MKLQFEGNLDYQQQAIASIVDVFQGQEVSNTAFTVYGPTQANQDPTTPQMVQEVGLGNKLTLLPSELLHNLQGIQIRNGLPPSPTLDTSKGLDLTVEMETGTGKTYVYLRTMLELHKQHGFMKFIIVVPSISIKEGVRKSLEITEEHLKSVFDNVPYKYFVYDSSKLSDIRDFAVTDQVRIMVINIQAFAADAKPAEDGAKRVRRILLDSQDKIGGSRPRDLLANTRPIVIVDEPQSSLSTPLQKAAVQGLNPLAVIRYSATHKELVNLVYRLDAIDAYQQGLVKTIYVSPVLAENVASSGAYVHLISVQNIKGKITAKIELDERLLVGTTKRVTKTVSGGQDLADLVGNLSESYEGYYIAQINVGKDDQSVEFRNGAILRPGQTIGGMDDLTLKREMIKATIARHLEQQIRLRPLGIKVLSLFFIDRVANYKVFSADGDVSDGDYATIFDAEYANEIRKEKYRTLFDPVPWPDNQTPETKVHEGYFSASRVKKASNPKESFVALEDTSGSKASDEGAYELIMKNKERLLSFAEPVSFLFSHSALKEGWDNPNVFQICTLKDAGNSDIRRRQEIGRGLRLAVNQDGLRVKDKDTNHLTVFATETYEEFAKGLQKEYEDEGIKFGHLEAANFTHIVTGYTANNQPILLSYSQAKDLQTHLLVNGYINKDNKIQETLRRDLLDGKVKLPEAVEAHRAAILKVIRKVAGDFNLKPLRPTTQLKLQKEVFLSPDFEALWNKIKYKTTYSVSYDSEVLISKCIDQINLLGNYGGGNITIGLAKLGMAESGVSFVEEKLRYEKNTAGVSYLPDIVTALMDDTQLTRRSINRILQGVINLDNFKRSPQRYIDESIKAINRVKATLVQDGIKYTRIGDHAFYGQELFNNDELKEVLMEHLIPSSKSPFEHVLYDSTIERTMAEDLERSSNVVCYAKLPSWFTIPTPLGPYNPDWAILWKMEDGSERLYLVVETKGTNDIDALRPEEKAKIKFGKAHFAALDNGTKFKQVDSLSYLAGTLFD